MIKISKIKNRKIVFHNRTADLFVCNFNGKITYKYVDTLDNSIRSKSFTSITGALRDMKKEYKKIKV